MNNLKQKHKKICDGKLLYDFNEEKKEMSLICIKCIAHNIKNKDKNKKYYLIKRKINWENLKLYSNKEKNTWEKFHIEKHNNENCICKDNLNTLWCSECANVIKIKNNFKNYKKSLDFKNNLFK